MQTQKDALIEAARTGLAAVVDGQIACARVCRRLMQEVSAKQEWEGSAPALGRVLGSFESVSHAFIHNSTPQSLRRLAVRDYAARFDGARSDHALRFLELLHTALLCKDYGKAANESWTEASRIISHLPAGSMARVKFNEQISQGLLTADLFQKIAAKLIRWAGAPDGLSDFTAIAQNSSYDSARDYTLEAALHGPDFQAIDDPAADETQIRISDAPAGADICFSGTRRWSSTSDYVLEYSPAAFLRERMRFNRIVLIETHLGAVRGESRRQLIFNLARGRSEAQVEKRYERFLFRLFESVVEIEELLLKIPAPAMRPFLFHLGILNFYTIVRRFLDQVDSGRMHSRHEKTLLRHLPVQLIRKVLIEWWGQNILGSGFNADDEDLARSLCSLVISAASSRLVDFPLDQPGPFVLIPLRRFRRLRQDILQWRGNELPR